jgi:haloalkane dehalogenase
MRDTSPPNSHPRTISPQSHGDTEKTMIEARETTGDKEGVTAMSDSSKPFAPKKYFEIKGRRMACIDEGEGAAIVFQHGNPTSSYLWRNVMPACRGLGRLVACDLIGMGDSDKLPDSGPDRYSYAEQRDFLFAFWEELKLGNDVIFVLHDWGSALGFD